MEKSESMSLKPGEIVVTPREDGRVDYVRQHEGYYEQSVARVVQEGQALPPETEVMVLNQIQGNHFRVTAEYKTGPAKVSTPAYKTGWDRIFGGKATVGEA